MVIADSMIWRGIKHKLIWHDCDSFEDLPIEKCQQTYGVCFYGNKLVITHSSAGYKHWNLVGGHIEKGESIEGALLREVQEETNMRVLTQIPIGYQEVFGPDGKSYYQLRSACVVEPIGKFEKDPAGSITEIKLIDPKDYKKYFDWGKIGDRLMARAMELYKLNFSSTTS